MKLKLNLPNVLVIIRIFIAIIVMILLMVQVIKGPKIMDVLLWITLILFLVASATDYFDGCYARKHNQITAFGKLFDPLADKILINSVMIFFTIFGWIPVWFTVLFVVRDIMVDGLRMNLAASGEVMPAGIYGKLKTVFQMLGLMLLFIPALHPDLISLNLTFNWDYWYTLIPLMIALVFSLWSGVLYYFNALKGVKNEG